MASINSYKSDIIARILYLSSLFSSDSEFLKTANINNHTFISSIKKGAHSNPGAEYLESIVRGTGCSARWLLLGEGEAFSDPESLETVPIDHSIYRVIELLSSNKERKNVSKDLIVQLLSAVSEALQDMQNDK